ncbi:hypothetical protein IHE49_07215 [Rhodanobacter sp. 7MK24]|uniref:hypothetical protein n=1 Tax=Rhodanobacter sp. 7MK24 TaxID=2775922 RepID=UPI0017829E53|nr:hypothetical protein [Rhodanobacter sp. 7MK24]MBD8880266.1 hypothetical protein [Rhodanobacter sp. 7MK24]
MPDFERIRKDVLGYLSGQPEADVCVQVLSDLENRERENLKILTYQSFTKSTRRSAVDPLLVKALNFFVTSSKFHLLDQRFLMFDEQNEFGVEIPNKDVAMAYQVGSLTLPDGTEVEDIDAHLLPYFTASAELLAMKVR